MKLLMLGIPALASMILLANPNSFSKDLGKISLGIVATNLISLSVSGKEAINKKKSEPEEKKLRVRITELCAEQRMKTATFLQLEKEAKEKIKNLEKQNTDLIDVSRKINSERESLANTEKVSNQLILDLKNERQSYQLKNETLQGKIREIAVTNSSDCYGIVENSYKTSYQKVTALLSGWKSNYPELDVFWNSLEGDLDKIKSWAIHELESYGSLESFEQLLNQGLHIASRIHDKCADLRIKGYSKLTKEFEFLYVESHTQEEFDAAMSDIVQDAALAIQESKSEIQDLAKSWIENNNKHKANYEGELSELLQTGSFYVERIQHLGDKLIELENQLAETRRPRKFFPATREDLRAANLIIEYLEPKGFILHKGHSIYHKHTAKVFFQTEQLISISELNSHSEHLMRICKTTSPVVFSNDPTGLVEADLVLSTPQNVDKASQFKPPTCQSLVEKAARSFIISGHPGSGKTSAIKKIAQLVGGQEAMRLALTPHEQDKVDFENAGFIVYTDKIKIEQAIAEVAKEVEKRSKSTNSPDKYLIVAIDELNKIFTDAQELEAIDATILKVALEGRKLKVIILLGAHSQTTKNIHMDGQLRESFIQIFLVGAAKYKMTSPGFKDLKQSEIDWINNAPYPCLININGQFSACQHPTHSAYAEYADVGLPPIGIENWEQNPVILSNMNYPVNRKKSTK